jgi:hypothetical protein
MFLSKKGDIVGIWKQDGTPWRVFEGRIQEVKEFHYVSREEVRPYFRDDLAYLEGKSQPDEGTCVAIFCDLTEVGGEECPIKTQWSWARLPPR